jgi:hypothetical protein
MAALRPVLGWPFYGRLLRKARKAMRRSCVTLSVFLTLFLTLPASARQAQQGHYNPPIDPANFTTKINNPFFPLKPGTVYTYRGSTDAGDESETIEVTHSTRVLMGVTTVEVLDTVLVNGALQEFTHDWYAQDLQGNVWYFGEDTKDYSGGVVSTEGSWLAGVDGGLPGVIMEANPQLGDVYRQEYLKHVAEDMGEVVSLDGTVTVPFGTFSGCVVTKDSSRLDKKSYEYKWYAHGIGLVKSMDVVGGSDVEELVSVTKQ